MSTKTAMSTNFADLSSDELFDKLKSGLKKVKVDGEMLYRVEGDLLLDEDELTQYAADKTRSGSTNLSSRPDGLLGITQGGKIVRWSPGVVLTYCVIKSTFSSVAQYNLVRELMRQATSDWESTCGVKFQYKEDLDGSNPTPTPAGLVFIVREIDAQGMFIASAFFPNGPTNRRRVLIDPSFYTLSPPPAGFSQVGVLRHELGHVLGFRHEMIRSGAPITCPDESLLDTVDLTKYDPQSVMHYFCGGVGTREMAITELDKTGAQKLYGNPLNMFRDIAT
ncbi:MAG TPA: matrixin family metalloprotease [Blastocatellia bacterium]|nr:matrixin family metalloprotease [Blastocatellia bacterium]